MDKFFVNLGRYGNTSAASIPIALCEAVDAGRLKPGDHLVMVGFGAGLTWAASVIQWGVPKPPVPAWRRTLDGLRYAAAGVRSRARRLQRRLSAVLFGSPEPRTIDEGASQLKPVTADKTHLAAASQVMGEGVPQSEPVASPQPAPVAEPRAE
jgi:3-oxoacyl-[acyl-carrier-protein] synthase-3